jgi:hypothetical protein
MLITSTVSSVQFNTEEKQSQTDDVQVHVFENTLKIEHLRHSKTCKQS